MEDLAVYQWKFGTGLFVYRACAGSSAASGHSPPDPVQLTQLIGYESQQDALLKNTEFLLAGYPALHVLFTAAAQANLLL